MRIYGINATVEALRSGRAVEIHVSDRRRRGLDALLTMASRARVRVRRVEVAELDRMARGGVHQGVVATVTRPVDYSIADLVGGPRAPLLVVLDGIEDPQNLGAVVRAAEAAGVDGIVLQTRRVAARGGAAIKASAGALNHARLAPVVNVSRAVEELKAAGVWTVGLDAGAGRSLYDLNLTVPTALVIGAEGRGLRRLVRERCNWLAALPMHGQVASLNVAVTAGIALFEAVRQRMLDG